MTFSNPPESDPASLNAFRDFRQENRPNAKRDQKSDHFLEVFNPTFDIDITENELVIDIDDMIIKALTGVTSIGASRFLKIEFTGANAMSDFSSQDPGNLIVGILGGAKGNTRCR